MPPSDLTLVSALGAAVIALFALCKLLLDRLLAAKDASIADLRSRLDKREAFEEKLLEATRVSISTTRKAMGDE